MGEFMNSIKYLMLTMSIFMLAFTACSTVTIRDKGTKKIASNPTYESSEAFFLWGLVGEKHIDVTKICGNMPAQQIQAQRTFVDGFLGLITLGIYMPRSVKIWCEKEKQS